MKNSLKFLLSIIAVIISVLIKVESLWSLKNLIFNKQNQNEMESVIEISSSFYWTYQIIVGIIIGIITYFVIDKLVKNRERTNIFHWMYNYKFKQINEYYEKFEKSDEVKFYDKDELLFMAETIHKKYPNKTRTDIIKLLEPHYSKFLDKNSPDYINLKDKPVK